MSWRLGEKIWHRRLKEEALVMAAQPDFGQGEVIVHRDHSYEQCPARRQLEER